MKIMLIYFINHLNKVIDKMNRKTLPAGKAWREAAGRIQPGESMSQP